MSDADIIRDALASLRAERHARSRLVPTQDVDDALAALARLEAERDEAKQGRADALRAGYAVNDALAAAEERSRSEQSSRIATEKQLLLLAEALNDADKLLAGMWSFDETSRKNLAHTYPVKASDVLRAALAAQAVDRTAGGGAVESLIAALRQTSYDAPWYVSREPRQDNALAIKSGIYTVLTVGGYYDGGSDEQETALRVIVEAVNSLAAVPR